MPQTEVVPFSNFSSQSFIDLHSSVVDINTRSEDCHYTMCRLIFPDNLTQPVLTRIPIRRCSADQPCPVFLHYNHSDGIFVRPVEGLKAFECRRNDAVAPIVHFLGFELDRFIQYAANCTLDYHLDIIRVEFFDCGIHFSQREFRSRRERRKHFLGFGLVGLCGSCFW